MGVRACSKRGCENIMCDDIIDGNYICPRCQDEFKQYLEFHRIQPETEGDFLREFRKFTDIDRDESFIGDESMTIEKFFEKHKR